MSGDIQSISTVDSANGGGITISSSKQVDDLSFIIQFLNQESGKNFRITTKAHRKLLQKLIDKGFTRSQIQCVIVYKVKQWTNVVSMKPYIRPQTLFDISHFSRYLKEADCQSQSDLSPVQKGSR